MPDFVSAPLRVYVTQTPVACILYSLRPLRPAPAEPSPTRPKPAQAPGASSSEAGASPSPSRTTIFFTFLQYPVHGQKSSGIQFLFSRVPVSSLKIP